MHWGRGRIGMGICGDTGRRRDKMRNGSDWLTGALLIFIILWAILGTGCIAVFPKVPSIKDQEEKTCTYYLYHYHYGVKR